MDIVILQITGEHRVDSEPPGAAGAAAVCPLLLLLLLLSLILWVVTPQCSVRSLARRRQRREWLKDWNFHSGEREEFRGHCYAKPWRGANVTWWSECAQVPNTFDLFLAASTGNGSAWTRYERVTDRVVDFSHYVWCGHLYDLNGKWVARKWFFPDKWWLNRSVATSLSYKLITTLPLGRDR